jgi:predicted unusual protein kinase regulating ubiquinone biosynthesis (AarF/ABC1/UbiB family)
MESVVEADLRQLKLVLAVFERADRAVSTKKVHEEIAARLHEELDYAREAKHIALYRRMLAEVDNVHIPEAVAALSTDRLLTMTWLEGTRLPDLLGDRLPNAMKSFSPPGGRRPLSLNDRNAIAMNMFRAWYTPFYYYGVIHGDPHLGNYTVRRDNSLNLLDFGCIRVFRPDLVQGVITLYEALRTNNREMAAEAYKAWGFTKPSKALIDVLNIWAQFIYAPLLEDKTRLIEETNTGIYGRETASKVHFELRKLGGVEVPREFVFMDRAAIGLGSVFLRLKAEINWYRMFHDLIRDFDVKALAKRQAKALKESDLQAAAQS